jgi:hypothetical protein
LKNPYPKEIVDEVSGVSVPNRDYMVWQQCYSDALKECVTTSFQSDRVVPLWLVMLAGRDMVNTALPKIGEHKL